ncbi:MAG TPA: glycosyltransferase family 4 protein [Actinomycetota bacterium]|nr:glycosyltransferase family 4 protein [Actinomycetota bacterium]
MKLAVVGGIFGFPEGYRDAVRWTTETILVDEMRRRGHHVDALGHSPRLDMSAYDIVHVHHLSWGSVAASTDRGTTPFTFTLHATRPAYPRAAPFVMARADGIVALWPGQADAFARTYRTCGAALTVIPNGVDPNTFRYRPRRPPGSGPWRLLYVGQLIPAKGVDLLVRTLPELRRRHRIRLDLAYHVAIDEDRLRALVADLGVDDMVRFVGRTSQAELGSLYQDAHIVVLPSTGQHEALPSVLTEAMFAGALPVATDIGGIADQISPFGIVVPPGERGALEAGIEDAIQTYGDHCARAQEMSAAAMRRFSIASMVDAHERHYEALVAEEGGPRRRAPSRRLGTLVGGPALTVRRWVKPPREPAVE